MLALPAIFDKYGEFSPILLGVSEVSNVFALPPNSPIPGIFVDLLESVAISAGVAESKLPWGRSLFPSDELGFDTRL